MPKIRTNYPFMEEIRENYRQLIKDGKITKHTKVPFICNIHGEYWQTLNHHSYGHKCPKCGSINGGINRRKTKCSFMDEIHPDYKQLIKDKKILNKDKIPFICKKHGIYWQTLRDHSNHH